MKKVMSTDRFRRIMRLRIHGNVIRIDFRDGESRIEDQRGRLQHTNLDGSNIVILANPSLKQKLCE